MFGSYKSEDVTVLLKDVTGLITPVDTREREALMQSGVHYSELLPMEHQPSPAYLKTYLEAQERCAAMTAEAVARVAEAIWAEKGREAVLVSLARAGTPIGILIRRFIRRRYGADVPHYTVSIIKGRGIDHNAMAYILARHRPRSLQFVDGWTGKGAIQRELDAAMADFPGVDPGLAVLSDPACVAAKRGTCDDFLIPSACLNATVSGLLSRTICRGGLIGPGDFHGAVCFEALRDQDLTYPFINAVESRFPAGELPPLPESAAPGGGVAEVEEIARAFSISGLSRVRPSIGEATRVLLRRVPWKLLVRGGDSGGHLVHLYRLAEEKGVEVQEYPLRHYRACGLVRSLAEDGDGRAPAGL